MFWTDFKVLVSVSIFKYFCVKVEKQNFLLSKQD